MKNLISIFLFFTFLFSFIITWADEIPNRGNLIRLGEDTFKLKGYNISRIANGKTIPLANFARPTVLMLLKYRPHVKKHFSYDEKLRFFNIVEDVESEISAAFVAENKIWVGFSFYEGEGWEGYGGIGFYDLKSNEIGVLRHPALMDCSVKSLMVKDKRIYILTIGNYELSSTVCNGLVIIDMTNLEAKAFVPPGAGVLWDKDESNSDSAAKYYDKPISEVISDKRFITKPIKSWGKKQIEEILRIGLEQYMIKQAKQEKDMREAALSKATILVEQNVTINEKETVDKFLRILNKENNITTTKYIDTGTNGQIIFSPGFIKIERIIPGSPKKLCSILGIPWVTFHFNPLVGEKIESPLIYPTNVIPKNIDTLWMNAEKGKQWYMETSKYTYTIILENFEVKNAICSGIEISYLEPVFDSITFRVQIKMLAE